MNLLWLVRLCGSYNTVSLHVSAAFKQVQKWTLLARDFSIPGEYIYHTWNSITETVVFVIVAPAFSGYIYYM